MKVVAFLVMMLLFISPILAEVQEFGYSNPNLPILGVSGNITLDTVNNSIFWNGYPFDIDRWMLPDGSNSASLVTFTQNIQATNGTFEYVNVTKDLYVSNSTLYIGNVSISSGIQDNAEVLNISATEVRATYFVGDGSRLTNISFENGTVIAQAVNASYYIGGNYTGENYTGLNFFGGNFYGIYDWTAEAPWLIFNGTYLTFNESYFNQSVQNYVNNINASALNFSSITLNGTTITDWSQVNYTVNNDTVTYTTGAFSGSSNFVVPETFNFEIAQIIITPSGGGNYRFAMYELGTGETIDADLSPHSGVWNIFKSYPINNQVTLNFSNVAPSNSFTVTIKYFTNVQG